MNTKTNIVVFLTQPYFDICQHSGHTSKTFRNESMVEIYSKIKVIGEVLRMIFS